MEQINNKLMNWASILADNARAQAERAASMPFIYPHIALMPDAHLGKGATVGSVIPTLGAIIPAAVGVDIGCGMIALRTQFSADEIRVRGDLAALRQAIERAIPLSAGKYNSRIYSHETTAIEVSLDEEERVWLFLHSGSRGVGNKLAQRHIKIAQARAAEDRITLPDPDLAYLVEGTDEFSAYIRDLRWAQHFALLNREEMMHRVADRVGEWLGRLVEPQETVNTHHNYTERETHFAMAVWLSRKGAIDASAGKPGLIPGSMGTRSYVVTGKGNRLALNSSRVQPVGGAQEVQPRPARRRHGWHRVAQDRRVPRRDPRRVQGHRRHHGGLEGPGRSQACPAPDRQRQGQLAGTAMAVTTRPRLTAQNP